MSKRLRHVLSALAAVLAVVLALAFDMPREVEAGSSLALVALVTLAAYGIYPPHKEVPRG